jgi:hypothetical protein
MAVRRCKKADLKRIAKATGAAYLTSLSNMEGVYQSVLYLAQCCYSHGRCMSKCSVCGTVLLLSWRCVPKCSVHGTMLLLSWKVRTKVFCTWHSLCMAQCCYSHGR